MADETSLVSQLRGDWGLNHLLQALALGEGFEFHLLVCDNPRVANAVLTILEENAPGRAVRLQPSERGRDSRSPVRLEDFKDMWAVLAETPEGVDSPIVVIDASNASERDEPAWRELPPDERAA